jgi:hypothetical protein
MNRKEIESTLYDMVDALAAIEHERWSRWQRYVHKCGTVESDGSLLIPAELVRHWEQQINKPFTALSEAEKESDRNQVLQYLPLIVERLAPPRINREAD